MTQFAIKNQTELFNGQRERERERREDLERERARD